MNIKKTPENITKKVIQYVCSFSLDLSILKKSKKMVILRGGAPNCQYWDFTQNVTLWILPIDLYVQ